MDGSQCGQEADPLTPKPFLHTLFHTFVPQECPTSGLLLSEMVRMAPRPSQKAKSTDALKKNASDPYILATIAELFWKNRKVENARAWFHR